MQTGSGYTEVTYGQKTSFDQFLFNNSYQFTDRFRGEENYFNGKGVALPDKRVWDTSFIADIEKLQFHDWTKKGPRRNQCELDSPVILPRRLSPFSRGSV